MMGKINLECAEIGQCLTILDSKRQYIQIQHFIQAFQYNITSLHVLLICKNDSDTLPNV